MDSVDLSENGIEELLEAIRRDDGRLPSAELIAVEQPNYIELAHEVFLTGDNLVQVILPLDLLVRFALRVLERQAVECGPVQSAGVLLGQQVIQIRLLQCTAAMVRVAPARNTVLISRLLRHERLILVDLR